MPELQYWFSGAALWIASSFAISCVLGFIGIKEIIPGKGSVLLIGIALVVMFIGWWTAAEQEQAAAKREKLLDEMASTIKLIKESLPPIDTKGAAANLSNLTNDQIRARVSDIAKRMREFESKNQTTRNELLFNRNRLPANATDAERNAAFQEQTRNLLKQSTEDQNQFRAQLLPEALALREEMWRRLEITPDPKRSIGVVALDFGMLAGVSPLSEAANSLESLARKLP